MFAFGTVTIPDVAAGFGLAYVLVSPRIRRYQQTDILVMLGLAGALSFLRSPYKSHALLGWLGWLALGLAFLLVAERWSQEDVPYARIGMALGISVDFGLECFQWAVRGVSRPYGLSSHPNVEAAVLVAALGAFSTTIPGCSKTWGSRLTSVLILTIGIAALLLTGSRGGISGGLVALLTWGVLSVAAKIWRVSVRRYAGLALLVLLAVVGLLIGFPKGHSHNLIEDSGFDDVMSAWSLNIGSTITQLAPEAIGVGGGAAELVHEKPGWDVIVSYRPSVAVEPGYPYMLSLWAKPTGDVPAFVRVEAISPNTVFLARRTGRWIPLGSASAEGRLRLPVLPEGKWQRVRYDLGSIPPGTKGLRLSIVSASAIAGKYGLIDSIQCERGSRVTSYVPGRATGIGAFFRPVWTRITALRHPITAAGGRLPMWWLGLVLAAKRPVLGYGPGTEIVLVRELGPNILYKSFSHLHSFYLKMLVEGGSLALATVLSWFTLLARDLMVERSLGSQTAPIAIATLAGILLQCFFDPVLSQPAVAGALWISICIGLYAT